MNLSYRILWIDDQPSNVSQARDYIAYRLARKGFTLVVDSMTEVGSKQALRKKIHKYPGIDLVLLDYKLGEGKDAGDKVAKMVRGAANGTEIIFYSMSPPSDLRAKIAEQDIDGVYCTRRDKLGEQAWDVIQTTIKKVLDLNGFRGIVMNAVAEFDYALDQAIITIANGLEEGKQRELLERIVDVNCSFHAQKLDSLGKITSEQTIEDYVELLSSDQKHRMLRKVLDEDDDVDLARRLEVLDRYQEQVIRPRNALAHGRSEIREDGFVILSRGKETIFTEDRFLGILHNLADHDDNLKHLNMILEERAAPAPGKEA